MDNILLCKYFSVDWPLDLVSTIGGGIIGLILVFTVDYIRKPRVKFIGFKKVEANFGTLFKLQFKITGRKSPGICRLQINWEGGNVYAKWDETPNPIKDDNINNFQPELVPATFDQILFNNFEYTVPIVIAVKESWEVFSGWWFGKKFGYGPNPKLPKEFRLRLKMFGSDLSWTREFTDRDIIKET